MTHYRELQHFHDSRALQAVLGAVIVFVIVVAGVGAVITPEPTGQAFVQLLLFSSPVILVVLMIYYLTRVETRVGEEAIRVQLWPLPGRRIAFDEISGAAIADVDPLEYGGWGVRWRPGGRAYIAHGGKGRGVRLDLKNGMHVLIESRKPEELLAAIRASMQ